MKTIVKRRTPKWILSLLATLLLMPTISNAQSDINAIVKGSEILVGGLIAIFSSDKAKTNPTLVESVCIKNKMNTKITLVITKLTEEGEEIKKELIIPEDSKECFYDLPKGVYTYEITLPNGEIYKKGEYRFKDKTVITLKDEPKEEITTVDAETLEQKGIATVD